jgi:hypothetical protein
MLKRLGDDQDARFAFFRRLLDVARDVAIRSDRGRYICSILHRWSALDAISVL